MVNETKFVVLDLETTGLVPDEGWILEVAVQLADKNFDVIDSFSSVVWPGQSSSITSRDLVEKYLLSEECMGEVVHEMHTSNGLIDDILGIPPILSGFFILDAVEKDILSWLSDSGLESNTFPLMGSSVHFDREWMKKYMPDLEGWFTYRNFDVSSIKEMVKALGLKRFKPEGGAAHRALDDTSATLNEAKFYLETYFTSGENDNA